MLYALPDHDVMENLMPGIRDQHLSADEALARLRAVPGLVPVAINPEGEGMLYFADIGDVPLVEWKYIYTIERLAKEGGIGEMFTTGLDLLERDDLITDSLVPQGFLFHVSRCGSTLLTKSLARSPKNVCINQGGPLQEGFWAVVTDHWQHQPEVNERNIRMFRNVVFLMSRRRRPEYERCFIKFISWNVIFMDFIRAAFPEVPIVYLYRDPAEVIATVLQETTAVLRAKGKLQSTMLTGKTPEETGVMNDAEYLAWCYAQYFRIARAVCAEDGNLSLLNYSSLKHQELYEDILDRGFNLRPDPEELELMRSQYRFYSKDDSDKTIFKPDSETLTEALSQKDRELVAQICQEGISRLNSSPQNLFPAG
jgi:hypothetical protein